MTTLGDQSERAGESGVAEDVAGPRRVAAGQEARGGSRNLAQHGSRALPVVGDDLADGEPLLGVLDRRLEQLREVLRPEPLPQGRPAIDAARHRPAQRSMNRDRRPARDRGTPRSWPGRVPDHWRSDRRASATSRPRRSRRGRPRCRTTSARPRRSPRSPRSPHRRRCPRPARPGSPRPSPAADSSPPDRCERAPPIASSATAPRAGRARPAEPGPRRHDAGHQRSHDEQAHHGGSLKHGGVPFKNLVPGVGPIR